MAIVVCTNSETGSIYRPRRPRQSPLYQLMERYYPQFERTYDQRYQQRYGPWRPIIGEVVRRFLTCGDLHFGFARVRCPKCRHEMFVPFSCRQRCVCPSCHQKRTLLSADTIANSICASVPHRQVVFTIPKRLRLHFRFDRPLLGDLARAAWETVIEVDRSELGRHDILPGMIAGIQTFGQLVHFHCHQIFSALDFLAELTQHIPEKGEHLARYYGWYSHRRRGMRAKLDKSNAHLHGKPPMDRSAFNAERSANGRPRAGSLSTWTMLIKRIYEVDPLKCAMCGGEMKVISFVERRQRGVIERILRHCDLWEAPIRTLANARGPPSGSEQDPDEPRELQLVLDPEFL